MSALTLVSAWTLARKKLGEIAGLDSPTFEARLFVEAATGATRLDIVTDPHREIAPAAAAALEAMLSRRAAREPAAQILGYKHFWTLQLTVSPAVLTPRPETETLVRLALELMAPNARVLDLGTGSGAIVLALLAERPDATGIGVDKSEAALAIAAVNGAQSGLAERVRWRAFDWHGVGDAPETSALGDEGGFDLIVSNPPYVRSGAISLLEPEVSAYEPHLALDGGPDGLDAYRTLFPLMRRLLRAPDSTGAAPPRGSAAWVVEIGEGQAEAVWALADDAGLRPQGVRADIAGIIRVVYGGDGPTPTL